MDKIRIGVIGLNFGRHHVRTLANMEEAALDEGFHIHAGLAPLGKGATDWTQVLRLMAPHVPEDSWAILEHVQTPEEGRASLNLLRQAAEAEGILLV